jgi:hypothetical protein
MRFDLGVLAERILGEKPAGSVSVEKRHWEITVKV